MAKKKFKTFEVTADGQLKIIAGSTLDAVVAELRSLGSNITKAELRAANQQWVSNNKLDKGVFTSQAEIKLNIQNLPYDALGLQFRGGVDGGTTGGTTGGGTTTGQRTETRRVAMGVTNGIQQWQIFYDDGTFEYKYLDLNNNTWMDSNPFDGMPDQPGGPIPEPELPVLPTGPTGPTLPEGLRIPSFETFKSYMNLAGIDDDAMAKEIYDAAQSYLADGVPTGDILDLLAVSGKNLPLFNKFIGNFNSIKSVNPEITTIAEWMGSRKAYQALLSEFGLNSIATYDYADQFLKNGVSYNEAADRLNTAYYAVTNADEALKQQLKTYFPSLGTADLVANILGIGQTVAELQKKIGMSGIRAEAATAGLAGRLSAEELYAQGISRGQARQGYQEVKAQKPLAEAAASRARQEPETIQTELEKESLLGLRSRRRAQLAAREQAYFAGRSGTANISLGGSTSGAF